MEQLTLKKERPVSFKTSKLAKQRGIIFEDIFEFNYACYHLDGTIKNSDAFKKEDRIQTNIPTQALLQKYFREVHELHIQPVYHKSGKYNVLLNDECGNDRTTLSGMEYYDSYEDALEAGLLDCLIYLPNIINYNE